MEAKRSKGGVTIAGVVAKLVSTLVEDSKAVEVPPLSP